MPAYKNQKTGEWYCIFRVTDWTGKRKQIKKSCFARRADALAYEREYLAKSSRTTKMKFGSLVELYMADAKTRLRPTTYEMKQWIFETKILPYFKDQLVDEVSVSSIRAWQNHLIDARDKNGKPYSATYLKTINNQMSALFRFAGKYYGLKENPVSLAGSMGKSSAEEMQFWTLEEFQKFIAGMSDPTAYAAFNILFWTGMREGELLALTLADVDFERKGIFVRHSYARLNGGDVISDRVHDIRHSHASLLINMGTDALLVQQRLGHEKVSTTLGTYAHLYPDRTNNVADRLEALAFPGEKKP